MDTIDHPGAQWLPDGRSVVVTSSERGKGSLDAVRIDGTQSRPIVSSEVSFMWALSAWQNVLLYVPEGAAQTSDIYIASISGEAEPQPFVATEAAEFHAQFSSDGSMVAYTSDETGRPEVFVAAFPQPGGRWQVSQGGGSEPRWNRNGRELFYIDPENYIVAVEVDETTMGFQTGAARRLFQFHGAGGFWRYDVDPDGTRFLVTVPLEEDLAMPVTLITDWTRKMRSR